MTISSAEKRIKELRNTLEKHRVLYHVQDAPEISDEVYDSLLQELGALEKKHPEYDDVSSPTHRVGGEPLDSFVKVTHAVPQWSFDNVFSFDELLKWEERNTTLLKKEMITGDAQYVVELKIDGLKAVLTYEKGIFVRGATRGNGEVGEDITENLRTIKTIPLVLPTDISCTVIGEVWMKKKDLERINKERATEGLPVYANPRNLAAGTLRQLDPKIVAKRNLQFFAYDIEGGKCSFHEEELKLLESFGFLVNQDRKVCKNLEEVQKFYDLWKEKKDAMDYGVDGMVIKIDEKSIWNRLGYTAKSPRGGIAYKFPAEEVTTVLEDITFQVGRTGAITPVALLTPVSLAGSVVRRATLHNEEEIKRLGICIGDTVSLRKAGDVIPEIFDVIISLRPHDAQVFIMPSRCPKCDSLLEKIKVGKEESAAWYCKNKNCPAQHLENLIHFVSKKGMNIEGLGEKIVETFYDIGLISDSASIYSLKKSDIEGLEGFGGKSAENIITSIETSRKVVFHKFLYALGVRHVGEQTAKDIAKHFETFEALQHASLEGLYEVEGVGEIVAESLYAFLSDEKNKLLLEKLLEEVEIQKETSNKTGKLQGLSFVITGTLPTLSRDDAKKIIEDNGGKVSSSVSSKTNYLLAGENAGSKLVEAKKYEVTIISEEVFKGLL